MSQTCSYPHPDATTTTTVSAAEARDVVHRYAAAASQAQRQLASATRERKDAALLAIAAGLRAHSAQIIAANRLDYEREQQAGMTPGLLDRLMLDAARVEGIASAVESVAALPDPVGEILDGQRLPNGLRVSRRRVPLGVVGVIYEARPNVTVDVAVLALKAGNGVILRGGSAAIESNTVLVGVIREALETAGFSADLVSSVDALGRAGATAMMNARGDIDVLVPRGGAGLIASVVENARVPVIETGSGNCHIYVDATADADAATPIVLNAKTQRVGVCNAAETLLVHRDIAAQWLPQAAQALWEAGTTLHACEASYALLAPIYEEATARTLGNDAGTAPLLVPATQEDWDTEYGSLDLAVRIVEDCAQAIDHIEAHSTGHTEAILATDTRVIDTFVSQVTSAAVMVNASTRFTDGGQLGLGAELGISTQKLHARGPMGLSALTTYSWVVVGQGHVRP